jgi:hypothetical protein
MSVLLYDPAEKRHLLAPRDGPCAGQRWYADLRVCDNPCCGCFHINFECVRADVPQDTRPISVDFVLDTEKRRIESTAARKSPPNWDDLAESVVKELGESGWQYLYEFLLGVKQEQIENCEPRHLDATFPPDVLTGDGTVVGYGEIFPLAPALALKIGSEQWDVIDDYCVNPDCSCRQVVLQFVTRDECSVSRTKEKPPPAIYYDYRSKTFEQAQAPEKHQPSLQDLLAALKDHTPRLDGELMKRHQRLKALFKRALAKHEAAADEIQPDAELEPEPQDRTEFKSAHLPKPGRNDPCPCGSGKKYKKCCGR